MGDQPVAPTVSMPLSLTSNVEQKGDPPDRPYSFYAFIFFFPHHASRITYHVLPLASRLSPLAFIFFFPRHSSRVTRHAVNYGILFPYD